MHSDDLRTAILLQLESGREYGAWDRRITAAQEQIAAWRGGPMVGMDELLDHLDKFLTSPPGEQGDDHAPQ